MKTGSETVYIKADRNVEVTKPDIKLGDVIKIECINQKLASDIEKIHVYKFKNKEGSNKSRIVISALKIISCIHREYPDVEIQNLGESDFIVTYEEQKTAGGFVHILKAILVVIISFCGSAFSIITFNNDVDVTRVFSQIYELTTGMKSDGFTVIELFYSIGIVIGILVFFNHFGKKRFTVDPTPIEVEMRLYENDLQTTLIEDFSRKEQELDVGP